MLTEIEATFRSLKTELGLRPVYHQKEEPVEIMMRNKKSTFDRFMSDPEQKKKFEKEYVQFLFSELLLEAMDEEHISVRGFSKESGVSTSVIQNMRAMKPTNITMKTMTSLLKPLGYQLTATKDGKTVELSI